MSAVQWERIQLAFVIALGVLLMLAGLLSAFNTHLAPTCPGPTLDCFMQMNADLRQEVDGR